MWPPALMDCSLEQEQKKNLPYSKSDGLILFHNEYMPITGRVTQNVAAFFGIGISVWSSEYKTIRDLMLSGF